MESIKRYMNDSINVVKRHYRPYIITNVGLYGTSLACMAIAVYKPEWTEAALKSTDRQLNSSAVGRQVAAVYDNGHYVSAAIWTFIVNMTVGAFGTITLPSIFVPFSGVGMEVFRHGFWGILFPPFSKHTHPAHLLTMLIEGQAYVLATLGSWIMGKSAVELIKERQASKGQESTPNEKKGDAGNESLWSRYMGSVKESLRLYPLISAILGVAAVWEAWEVIYFKVDLV